MPFLGNSHLFDWDEVNFAECAREMIETGDYTTVRIDFEPFWEKPPMFFWMQALSMKVFGVNEYAARFPDAVAGILILLVLFYAGKKFYNERFGLYFALSYFGGWLPFIYSKSGIIDPWFNLFMFLSVWFMLLVYSEGKDKRMRNVFLSAVFASLATLTKGPVGILIPGLTYIFALLFHEGPKKIISVKEMAVFAVTLLVVGGTWFFILVLEGKTDIIVDFVMYQIRLFSTQDAGHGGPFFYHFVVLLLGYFHLSFFAVYGMRRKVRKEGLTENQQRFSQWNFILFWVVLILFSIVKTKIIHYSSLAYFPVAYFSALAFYRLDNEEFKKARLIKWLTFVLAFLWAAAIAVLPWVEAHKELIIAKGLIGDEFAKEALLTMNAGFGYSITVLSVIFIIVFGIVVFTTRDKRRYFVRTVFLSAVFLEIIIVNVVPKVEVYSQRAAIDFYKRFQGEKVYIYPLGFKSYAHLFYTRKPAGMKKVSPVTLLKCGTDYPAYFVVKVNNAGKFEKIYPSLKRLYAKGGFVFYEVNCKNKKE